MGFEMVVVVFSVFAVAMSALLVGKMLGTLIKLAVVLTALWFCYQHMVHYCQTANSHERLNICSHLVP